MVGVDISIDVDRTSLASCLARQAVDVAQPRPRRGPSRETVPARDDDGAAMKKA
jgi:hypothetical protein